MTTQPTPQPAGDAAIAQRVSDATVLAALRKHVDGNFETQAAFALSLHVSPSYVSDVLNGRREIPADWVFSLGFRKAGWERFDGFIAETARAIQAGKGEGWSSMDSAPVDDGKLILVCEMMYGEPDYDLAYYKRGRWEFSIHDGDYRPTYWKSLTSPDGESK